MKKRFSILALLLTLVLVFTACQGDEAKEPANEAGQEETETEETEDTEETDETSSSDDLVEITIGFWDIEEAVSGGEDDEMLQTLQEKTGVKIVPKDLTSSDYHEKVQLWASNDQLPDVFSGDFIGLGQSTFFDWVDQGVIRALPDDLSDYPHLEEYLTMERAQEAKQDGKQYIIPSQSYGELEFSVLDRNIVYRWDLAQEAGITEEPETWDEFREMLLAIMEADPEGKNVGGMNQVGLKTLAGVMYPYGGILEKKWILDEDGVAVPSMFEGDIYAVMNLARDMYEEGTITQDVTQATGNTAQEAFLNGSVAAMSFNGGPMSLYKLGRDWESLYDRDFLEDVRFAKIWPNSNGENTYFVDTEAWSEKYIASHVDDEKMEAILRLFDFLVSEEGKLLLHAGIEGEDYELVDGEFVMDEGTVLTDKYPFALASHLALKDPAVWDLDFPSPIPMEYREENVKRHADAVENGVLPDIVDRVMFLSTPKKDDFFYDPHTDFYTIMTATEPVDEMVDKLLAEYEAKGLEEMIEEVNDVAKEKGLID